MVRALHLQSRDSGFKSYCCQFETWGNLFMPHYCSSLSVVNEYLAVVVDICVSIVLCIVATWLNASQRNLDLWCLIEQVSQEMVTCKTVQTIGYHAIYKIYNSLPFLLFCARANRYSCSITYIVQYRSLLE